MSLVRYTTTYGRPANPRGPRTYRFLWSATAIEETYFTFSYSAIHDESGAIGGVLVTCVETTERVIGERRLKMLRELGTDLAAITTEDELFSAIRCRLETHARDLPFALVYLWDPDGKRARLTCAHGAAPGDPIAPVVIDLALENELWPAPRLLATGAPVNRRG